MHESYSVNCVFIGMGVSDQTVVVVHNHHHHHNQNQNSLASVGLFQLLNLVRPSLFWSLQTSVSLWMVLSSLFRYSVTNAAVSNVWNFVFLYLG
jgi:hypothetical protein